MFSYQNLSRINRASALEAPLVHIMYYMIFMQCLNRKVPLQCTVSKPVILVMNLLSPHHKSLFSLDTSKEMTMTIIVINKYYFRLNKCQVADYVHITLSTYHFKP